MKNTYKSESSGPRDSKDSNPDCQNDPTPKAIGPMPPTGTPRYPQFNDVIETRGLIDGLGVHDNTDGQSQAIEDYTFCPEDCETAREKKRDIFGLSMPLLSSGTQHRELRMSGGNHGPIILSQAAAPVMPDHVVISVAPDVDVRLTPAQIPASFSLLPTDPICQLQLSNGSRVAAPSGNCSPGPASNASWTAALSAAREGLVPSPLLLIDPPSPSSLREGMLGVGSKARQTPPPTAVTNPHPVRSASLPQLGASSSCQPSGGSSSATGANSADGSFRRCASILSPLLVPQLPWWIKCRPVAARLASLWSKLWTMVTRLTAVGAPQQRGPLLLREATVATSGRVSSLGTSLGSSLGISLLDPTSSWSPEAVRDPPDRRADYLSFLPELKIPEVDLERRRMGEARTTAAAGGAVGDVGARLHELEAEARELGQVLSSVLQVGLVGWLVGSIGWLNGASFDDCSCV